MTNTDKATNTPSQLGKAGGCATAHAKCCAHCSPANAACTMGTSNCQAHCVTPPNKPTMASGNTTKLTSGMANRLTNTPTTETWPNNNHVMGANTTLKRHCTRHKAIRLASMRFGSESLTATLEWLSTAPNSAATATKLNQKPALSTDHGSHAATTANTHNHTAGHDQRKPKTFSAAHANNIKTVR